MMAKLKANKLLALLLCLVMVVGLFPTVAFAEEDGYNIGDDVTISFTTQGNPGFACAVVEISYDSDALELTGFGQSGLSENCDDFQGSIDLKKVVIGYSDNTMITGDGVLFTATFKIKSTATVGKTYDVTVSALDAAKDSLEIVSFTINGGSIKVTGEQPEQNEVSFIINKTVEQTGDVAPGETTFNFIVATTWNNPTDKQIIAKPTITITGAGTGSTSVNVKTASDQIYIWEVNDGASGWSYSNKLYKILKAHVTYYYECDPSTGNPVAYCLSDGVFDFTNSYTLQTGGVTIQKSVTGDLAPEENGEAVDYYFNLKLLDKDGNAVAGKVYHQKTGGNKWGQQVSTAGYEFSLKKDESITFSNIPDGTKVLVEELSTGDFTTSIFFRTDIIRNTNSYVYTIEGNKTRSVQFNNDYGDKTGSLTVSKTVSGNGASTTKAFPFTVYVYNGDAPLEGTYGDMVFDEYGKATFTLTDGQSVKATGLPVGYSYYVEETDSAGYTVTAKVNGVTYDIGEETGVEGIIESDNLDIVVKFDNNKTNYEPTVPDKTIDGVPETGDEGGMGIWIALAILSLIGMAALAFVRKRNDFRRM